MPPTPRQLHEQGIVDLTNPTTWKVRIADEKGKEITCLDSNEFSAVFANDEDLSRHTSPKSNHLKATVEIPNRLDWKDIKLDGSVIPSRPLTEKEALLVLKTYMGL